MTEARIEGKYKLNLFLLNTNVPNTAKRLNATWSVDPVCRRGGGCDVKVHSLTGKYRKRALFINGKLRFSRSFNRYYTCGSGDQVDYYIAAVREIEFHAVKMELIDDEWIATALQGFEINKGTRGCGLPAETAMDKYALRARLVG